MVCIEFITAKVTIACITIGPPSSAFVAPRMPIEASPKSPPAASPYSAAGCRIAAHVNRCPFVAKSATPTMQIAAPNQPPQRSGSPSSTHDSSATCTTSVLAKTVPTAKLRASNARMRHTVPRICAMPPPRMVGQKRTAIWGHSTPLDHASNTASADNGAP